MAEANGNGNVKMMAAWTFSILSLISTVAVIVHHFVAEKNLEQDRLLHRIDEELIAQAATRGMYQERVDRIDNSLKELEKRIITEFTNFDTRLQRETKDLDAALQAEFKGQLATQRLELTMRSEHNLKGIQANAEAVEKLKDERLEMAKDIARLQSAKGQP